MCCKLLQGIQKCAAQTLLLLTRWWELQKAAAAAGGANSLMKRADKGWGSLARSHIVCLAPHRRRRRLCSSFGNVSWYEAGQVEFPYLLHLQYLTLPKSDNAPGHRQPWRLLGLLAKQRRSSTCSCLSPLSGCSTIYMHIQQCGNNKANLADSYSCLQLLLPASRDAGSRKHSLPGQTVMFPFSWRWRGVRGDSPGHSVAPASMETAEFGTWLALARAIHTI